MIAPVMPSDRGNGLAMPAGFFVNAYARRFDVDLVVAPVFGSVTVSDFARSRACRIEILRIDRPDSHYALVSSVNDPLARLEAFRRYGRPSLTAFVGPARHALARMAEQTRYQAVHVFRLYLAELAAPWIGGDHTRLVLDCDENDASVFYRIARLEYRHRNPVAAGSAEAEAEAFERFAAIWLPKFDLVYAASQKEVGSFSSLTTRALAIPNVLPNALTNVPERRRLRQRHFCKIVFVGSLGYAPNADAIGWFYSNVWRQLERALHHRAGWLSSGPIRRQRYRGSGHSAA
jgi:polysaccharide biosynthesis protein PslH